MLIAGGFDGTAALSSSDIVDLTTGVISPGPQLSVPRAALTATTLLDGRVLFAGGNDGSADLASADVYDPSSGTLAATGNMVTPRSGQQAFLLPNNNQVLLVGGSSAGAATASTELYVPWAGTFQLAGSLATPRAAATGSALQADGLLLAAGGSGSATAELYGFATVKTDKDDYAPGTMVTITGSGWKPGETVTLTLVETPYYDTHPVLTVIADASGHFVNTQFSPDEHDANIRFYLTATGSASQAQMTFTDSTSLKSLSVGTQSPSSVVVGAAATYVVSVGFNGNPGKNGTCTVNLSISTSTPLPSGATALFSPSSTITGGSTETQTPTLTIATTNATPAGTSSFTVVAQGTGGTDNNCTSSDTQTALPATLVTTNTATSLSVASASGVYGGTTTLSATLTSGSSPVSGKPVTFTLNGTSAGTGTTNTSGVATLSNVSFSGIGAGTYNGGIGASFAGDAGFPAASGTANLVVSKALLTVTADSKSRNYGDANPALTASYSGFVNGENSAVLSGSPTLSTTATAASAVGGYTITAAQGTLAVTNYTFTFITGTVTVGPAHLTVTADNKSRSYGDPNPSLTATLSGFKNGQTLATSGVTGTANCTTSAILSSPVSGSPYTIICTQGTLAAVNYDFTPFVSGQLTINKAHLTVTADNATRQYGDQNPTFTASYSGFKNSEILANSGVTGSPGLTTTATASSPVGGAYTITAALGTLTATNYDFTPFVSGQLTISKAHLTVTADNATRQYGDQNPTFTASYSGFKNSETLANSGVTGSPSLTTTASASSPVGGTYTITAAVGTLTATNYDFIFGSGQLSISKAHLTVTADNATRQYGDQNPTFTASYSGFKNSETLPNSGVTGGPSLTTTATANSPVGGAYTITAAVGTLTATNYDFTFVSGTLTISKAHLTVTADNATRQYGDQNPTFTASYSGFKNSEMLANSGVAGSPSLTTTAIASSPVGGAYTITAALGTLTATNYDFTPFVSGQLTISKAHLTVTADNATREYGDQNPTFSASYSGFKNSETLANSGVAGSPSLTTAATANSPVGGAYTITAELGTLTATNYDFTFMSGTLSISKAHLTVTADNASRQYGDANPTFAASYSGFKNNEMLANSGITGAANCTTSATPSSPVSGSPYTITCTQGTLAAGNYDFTPFINGTLTINKAPLTINPEGNKTKTFGSTFNAFTGTVTGLRNGDVVIVSYISSGAAPTANVGAYDITVANVSFTHGVATNYDIANSTATNGLAVGPATLIITPDGGKSKSLGATFTAFTGAISGLQNSDAVTVLYTSTGAPAGAAVGTYEITVSTVTFTSGSASNYNITKNIVANGLTVSYNVCVLYDSTKAVKGGATYPIKLYLCNVSGADVSSLGVVLNATAVTQIAGYSGAVEDAGNANPDSNFRYDPTLGPSGGYIFNLKTSGLATGTYRLNFTAGGAANSSYLAPFGVK
ncbi:MAG TPA: MBG domain-containing protein [Bryobacteraceae bacterium]|nr:MBG domain-containing protein [Bryobacteraceae bacterium]